LNLNKDRAASQDNKLIKPDDDLEPLVQDEEKPDIKSEEAKPNEGQPEIKSEGIKSEGIEPEEQGKSEAGKSDACKSVENNPVLDDQKPVSKSD